ncbi:MAG: hypothetical protein KIT72_17940 [Polyangiaceae bacterium]|nr:hypothetical protein [Polyangiaceae bacterium]MCW5792297.1 hypothetical protein [Polyangiaceae bacterium]
MDIRTGVRFPAGEATGEPGDDLASRYSWQVPIAVGLGAKLSPRVYLGGYLGFAFGAEGSDNRVEYLCEDNDVNLQNDNACSTVSFEIGAQLTYSFSPGERWNPWISYGLGYEVTSQSLDMTRDRRRLYSESTSSRGITFAKLGAGLDYRAKVGVGPFAEAAIGQFLSNSTVTSIESRQTHDIDDTAIHAWITVGIRLVIQP